MATQGSSSNSRLIAVGAVVLLFGVILVLLILRGTVGGDDPAPPEAAQDEPADAEGQPAADTERSDLVAEGEGSTARVPLPLELEDGMEAVSVRAAFARGVAALPAAGDRVVVYELGSAEDADETAPEGDADRVLDDVEVLGVIGPRPAANDGTLTFVLAVEEADVPGLLPIARDGHLWLTLLPSDEVDEADEGGTDGTEGEDEA